MRKHALQFTIGIVISLVIIILIIIVQRGAVNAYEKSLPYIKLSDAIEAQASAAHIWAEQVKETDARLDFEKDVIESLSHTKVLVQSLDFGGETKLGRIEKMEGEESKALVKETVYSIQNLMEVSQARWLAKPEVLVAATDSTSEVVNTSSVDILSTQLDDAVHDFRRVADRLSIHIDLGVQNKAAQLNVISWISILVLISAVAVVAFFLYQLLTKKEILERENILNQERQKHAANALSNFMEAISVGNYTAELDGTVNHGAMGDTLTTMRDKLRANAEEDGKRNWSTSGLAQIGELLRTSFATTQDLFDHIIKFVVKYTKSSQGGLFLLNEENPTHKFLELVACYAYERKKFLEKSVEIGEGLIGQSFLETESIYLAEVPEDYIAITSSLGSAKPNALLLMPLKVNGAVFGILEIATFGKYEPHEIELVEKLAESIASTISTVRINESTRMLLEKTQQQTEEMRAQEEEMRQNMEELEATQEEMRRKEKHIQTMLDNEKLRNEISNKNRQSAIELSKKADILEGNWDGALEKVVTAITKQLSVSRGSIWSFNHIEKKLKCEKLFENTLKKFEIVEDWFGKDYPGFFEAITAEEIILAKDARAHGATRELAENYLIRHGIQSMLVLPYFSEGKIGGILCCENLEQKDWSEEDVEFLKACSDLVTLTFNNRRIKISLDKLSDEQETMQTIIDNLPRAVFWKGKDLCYLGCNKIFAALAGAKSSYDLIGKSDYDMPWKEFGDTYRADDLSVMNSRKACVDMEERHVNNEGKVSWISTTKVPITNKQGEVIAVLGMFEDITERKVKEADIASKLEELENLKKMIEKNKN